MPNGPGAPRVDVGDEVVLLIVSDPADPARSTYSIVDHQRGTPLPWLAVLCAVAVVGFGRWRGLAALAGRAVSFAILPLFVLPAISGGRPPLLVAVVGAATIMLVVFYLTPFATSFRTSSSGTS